MRRAPLHRPPTWQFDTDTHSNHGLFGLWFAFCLVLSLATIAGLVWLVIYLLPHVTAFLDRA